MNSPEIILYQIIYQQGENTGVIPLEDPRDALRVARGLIVEGKSVRVDVVKRINGNESSRIHEDISFGKLEEQAREYQKD